MVIWILVTYELATLDDVLHKQDEINGSTKHFIFRNYSSDLSVLVAIFKKTHIHQILQTTLRFKIKGML